MAKNDFLERQAARENAVFHTGLRCGRQQIIDMFVVALRDPETMGKDTFGKERILKVVQKVSKLMDYFNPAFQLNQEADYYQELLDAHLRDAFGDLHDTFQNRYDYLVEFDYKKGKFKK